jgi:enoyl-CoA hydratase
MDLHAAPDLSFFEIERFPEQKYAILWLNRADKKNAMNWAFWGNLGHAVDVLERDAEIKTVIVAGKGEHFSIGMDFKDFFVTFGPNFQEQNSDNREATHRMVLHMQEGFNKMANGNKVYLAAVQGWCIGGGLDLISACDIRLASADAKISLREVKVAIVADMGSINRLPALIGHANTALMAYTGRDFAAEECQKMGLISQVCSTQEELLESAKSLAAEIAENSGITLRGIKQNLRYMRDHGPEDGLRFVAAWNAAFLDSPDLRETIISFLEKRKAVYA